MGFSEESLILFFALTVIAVVSMSVTFGPFVIEPLSPFETAWALLITVVLTAHAPWAKWNLRTIVIATWSATFVAKLSLQYIISFGSTADEMVASIAATVDVVTAIWFMGIIAQETRQWWSRQSERNGLAVHGDSGASRTGT